MDFSQNYHIANPLRILMIEDDQGDFLLFQKQLNKKRGVQFELTHAKNLNAGFGFLQSRIFDVVFLDLNLPDSSTVETVLKFREVQKHLPLIVISDLADDEVSSNAIRMGAQGYLTKDDISPKIIFRAIMHAIEHMHYQKHIMLLNDEKEIANRKLTELSNRLEDKVRERTRELEANRKELLQLTEHLRQTNLSLVDHSTKLEQKNRELDNFAFIASHDLREPLMSLNGLARLLEQKLEKSFDLDIQMCLRYIQQTTQRMNNLINDLLSHSQLGKTEDDMRPVNLNALLKEVLEDMDASIRESGATLTISQLPSVKVYCTEFKLLFMNLISNAIKYRKKDTAPIIKIYATITPDDFIFTVEDNGIGIDETYFSDIFIIFRRLHNQSEYNGTGIGLAHCKKIVDLHDGKIWVKSTLGVGSSFHFSIPLDLAEVED